MSLEDFAQALGLIANGTVGGFIIYTNKNGRKVIYPTPVFPPSSSPAQLQNRDRFRRAQAAWTALSDADKLTLETAVRRCSLNLTGQNLYLKLAMQTNTFLRLTLMRRTGLSLPLIPFVPFLP